MAEPKLLRAQGNWVDGDRFWDREEEIGLLMEYIEDGSNLLIVAMRRMGKTSIMHEAARRLGERFYCLHVDLQKSQSAADCVAELSIAARRYRPLWEKTASVFSGVLGRVSDHVEAVEVDDVKVKLRSGLDSGNWQSKGDRIFEVLAAADKPVVIFLDEVPILVNRMLKGGDYDITPERRRDADTFLSWLRANSIRHRARVSQVISGSIGLEPILRQARLNATLNNYVAFNLEAWKPEVAVGCLRALANQYGIVFGAGSPERMVERLGYCIPHHVQMFFNNVYEACKRSGLRETTVALVDEVYESAMLSVRGHAELSHMEERLRMVLGPAIHPLALELLTEASVVGILTAETVGVLSRSYPFESEQRAEAIREILGILEHDGYLLRAADQSYAFVSTLLRDWWAARFGFAFREAAKRKGGLYGSGWPEI